MSRGKNQAPKRAKVTKPDKGRNLKKETQPTPGHTVPSPTTVASRITGLVTEFLGANKKVRPFQASTRSLASPCLQPSWVTGNPQAPPWHLSPPSGLPGSGQPPPPCTRSPFNPSLVWGIQEVTLGA